MNIRGFDYIRSNYIDFGPCPVLSPTIIPIRGNRQHPDIVIGLSWCTGSSDDQQMRPVNSNLSLPIAWGWMWFLGVSQNGTPVLCRKVKGPHEIGPASKELLFETVIQNIAGSIEFLTQISI